MDAIKEFEEMQFVRVVDAEEFINSLPKEEITNYSILNQINRLKKFLNYNNRSVDNLYLKIYVDEIQYFYFDGIFLSYLNPNIDENGFCDYKEYFLKMEERFLKSYESGKITNLSVIIDKRLRPFMYRVFYDKLSQEQRFKGFVEIYKLCENPQQGFSNSISMEIQNYIPSRIKENRNGSNLVDKDGFITILRGQGSESTHSKKAMSWTTDMKTAKFFAYRFDNDGYVVKGKVHIDDVIFIYDEEYGEDYEDYKGDPEKEILVVPGSVIDIKRIKDPKAK